MIKKVVSYIVCFSLTFNLLISPLSVFAQEIDDQNLIISELMVDPDEVNDSKGEWIEVFNNSSVEVSLNEWVINDGPDHTISGDYSIPANGYAVICRNDDSEQNGGVKCDYQASMVLSNNGETVTLKDSEENTIDQIAYTEEDIDEGKSINVANDEARTISQETIFSYGLGDFGTPSKNTVSILTRSFATIQDALNTSQSGDTINVLAGEYSENLSIEEEINLVGTGVGQTVIFNNSCDDSVVTIDADNVNVRGFTLDDNECGYAVVRIDEGTGVVVEENEIINGDTGIVVDNALGNEALQNLITDNGVGVQNNDTENSFDASSNFWGDESGPFHESLNPEGQGNSVSDNVLFRPFYTESSKTTLSTFSVSEEEFNSVAFFSNGIFSLPEGVTDQTNTTSVTINEDTTFNVSTEGGISNVFLPSGTIIENVLDGVPIDATLLSTDDVDLSTLSGFTSNTVAEGALQWGIPNMGLEFSEAITLNIFVGASLNDQTLNVLRSTSTDSGWTSDGIVAPATCIVSSGICAFQATKASYFAATATDPTPTPTSTPTPTPTSTPTPTPTVSSTTSSTSDGGNGGSGSSSQSPVCNDTKPGSAPTLLSAILGVNRVTLNWSKGLDPFTYYLIAYGTKPGFYEFGNPNVGGKDTSYTVYDLASGIRYYFRVRAGNDCAPGDFSNELSAVPTEARNVALNRSLSPGVLGIVGNQDVQKDETGQEDIVELKPRPSPNSIPSENTPKNIFTPILNFFGEILSFFARFF